MKWFKKKKNYSLDPDEVFLDARNSPGFNTQQFEGRLEKPIPLRTIQALFIVIIVAMIIFSGKMFSLQVVEGESYFALSENNRLSQTYLFADRGVITDRNGVLLAWNRRVKGDEPFADRVYTSTPGFSHLLGYVSYPKQDRSGRYWQPYFEGKDGVERTYNALLQGENGLRLFETDVHGAIFSENTIALPKKGNDLTLTIDAGVQEVLHREIALLAERSSYRGGAGMIMDVHTGAVLAMTSFPEFDSNILSYATDTKTINTYLSDQRRVFINRAVSGLYTPGSIVKPFIAFAALEENIISPEKTIISTGTLTVPNPFTPGQDSIFRDWKAHGVVDMRRAIAVSSNIYFYYIGGGYGDQKGLGIRTIDQYLQAFKIGTPTGIDTPHEGGGTIPTPEWKRRTFPNDPWRLGDTYHTSIGQYGFQVTPVQMLRATAALANGGVLVTPHLAAFTPPQENISARVDDSFQIIREGMRMVVTEGTAQGLLGQGISVAAKTGTAQVGVSKSRVNSWAIGFFPYEKPKYAFVVLMESGPANQVSGAFHAMKETLSFIVQNRPQYTE